MTFVLNLKKALDSRHENHGTFGLSRFCTYMQLPSYAPHISCLATGHFVGYASCFCFTFSTLQIDQTMYVLCRLSLAKLGDAARRKPCAVCVGRCHAFSKSSSIARTWFDGWIVRHEAKIGGQKNHSDAGEVPANDSSPAIYVGDDSNLSGCLSPEVVHAANSQLLRRLIVHYPLFRGGRWQTPKVSPLRVVG